MNQPEQDESFMLARARRALSPTPADVDRVRASVRAAVLAAPATAGLDPGPALTRVHRMATRLLLAGTIAAASGGAGYWAGWRAGVSRARPPTPAAPMPAIVAAPPAAPPVAGDSPSPVRPAAPGALHQFHRARAPETPPGPSPESLARELEALRAVERALRDGHPGMALALLRDLDRTLPQGKLTEERRATEAIARCASGAVPLGLDLADDFASDYPRSVYRRRVEEACAQTDSDGAGDKGERRHRP